MRADCGSSVREVARTMLDPSFQAPPGLSDAVAPVLRVALDLAEDGDWEGAAEALTEALEDHPDDPYILCWLGLVERELGLEGVAYERFKQALAAGSDDPMLLATAGTAIAALDDPAAEPALRTAVLLGPDLPRARWMYGAYLSREGMTEQALEELERAVELDPEDPVIQFELGVAQALGGDLESASLSFARSLELDPANGWTLVLLGLSALLSDEVADSLAALEEGARTRPDDLEAQLLAALALFVEGWEDRAAEMLQRARLVAEAPDQALVDEVEVQMDAGAEAALELLQESLAPTAFRERLMQRP